MNVVRTAAAAPKAPLLWVLAFFAVSACIILGFSLPRIARTSFEAGDSAANSLLVQVAKDLRLFHGHYSRIGFYHPGPVLIYVITIGEVVLHDWLQWTSPIGGQLVAVIFFNAAWLTVIFALMVPLFGSLPKALLGIAAFCAMTAYLLPDVFSGMWFVFLFFWLFAALVIGLALATAGDTRHLPLLGVTIGFLLNAHVSFFGIVAIAVTVSLVANLVLFRFLFHDPHAVWLSGAFIRANWRRIVASLCIGGLFLVPSAMDVIVNWPGQIAGYLAYARTNAPHPLVPSVGMLLLFLGGGPTAVIGTGLLAGASFLDPQVGPRPLPLGSMATAFAALVAVTLGVLFYVRYGVDSLSLHYLLWFYYSVAALAVAMIVVWIDSFLPVATSRFWLALAIGLAVWKVTRSVQRIDQPELEHADTPAIYSAIRGVGERIALYPDTSVDWQQVWTRVVGLEAYGSRRGEKPFCVAANWEFAFSREYKCTAQEAAEFRPVGITAGRVPGDAAPIAEFGALKVFDAVRP